MVYLVGAGPGDSGLITQKGLECIKKADVIIYDHLANPTLLSYSRPFCVINLLSPGPAPTRYTI